MDHREVRELEKRVTWVVDWKKCGMHGSTPQGDQLLRENLKAVCTNPSSDVQERQKVL